MSAQQPGRSAPATAILYAANSWALNFILFALLIDVVYRALAFHEAAWDLLALIVLSGGISLAYLARHNAVGEALSRKAAISVALGALAAVVASAVLAMSRMN